MFPIFYKNKNLTKVYQVKDLCIQLALKVSKTTQIRNLVCLIKFEKDWKHLNLIFRIRNIRLAKNRILSQKNLKKTSKKSTKEDFKGCR